MPINKVQKRADLDEGKTLPQGLLFFASGFYEIEGLVLPQDNLSTAVIVDLSNAYSIIDQVHVPFAMGASVALVPGGVLNPWFYKIIPRYDITFLFTISAMFER